MLVIIGMVSSAVILTMPSDKPDAKRYTQMLLQETNAAAQLSLVSGEPSALGLSEDGYALLIYRNGLWQAGTKRPLPEQTSFRFERDNSALKLTETIVPLAVFEPTGQSTLFILKVAGENDNYILESRGDGRLISSGSR